MGKSNLRAFDRLACVLSDIQNMGYEVILVSTGAIAVGTNKLNMKERPSSMRMKQAAAAVGQCSIIYLYDKFFGDYDKSIAQILLNAEDMEQEEKKSKPPAVPVVCTAPLGHNAGRAYRPVERFANRNAFTGSP